MKKINLIKKRERTAKMKTMSKVKKLPYWSVEELEQQIQVMDNFVRECKLEKVHAERADSMSALSAAYAEILRLRKLEIIYRSSPTKIFQEINAVKIKEND